MNRVLFVIIQKFNPTMGGVERSTYRIGNELISRGYDVGVFSFEKLNGEISGIDISQFRIYNCSENGLNKNSENLNRLKEIIDEFKPDYIINQMPYEHNITRLLKAVQEDRNFFLIGCLRQTLFSVKNNIDSYIARLLPSLMKPFFKNSLGRKAFRLFHWYNHRNSLKFILSSYDKFTFYAEPNYDELSYFLPNYDSSKTTTIPNSLPYISSEVPDKEKRILWLGRLVYKQKRADFILPLWKILKDRLPDWEMDVVGEGSAYNDLQRQIKEERIDRITLYGRQIPDGFYSKAPIFVMTSAYEGFGNTVIEAQSYGAIPFLFDTYAMASWIVSHGNNGFLIEPFNINAMADSIIAFVESKQEDQLSIQENALKNARRFEIGLIGDKWEALLKELENSSGVT